MIRGGVGYGYATSITWSGDLGGEHVWRLGRGVGSQSSGYAVDLAILFGVEQGQPSVWELD